jgi:hypothetical protein
MYIVLDSSGSMAEPTDQGITKWEAVKQALATFFSDPASVNVAAGLQYFPQLTPGVPDTCTSNAQCGAHGPCVLRTCNNGSGVTPCMTNADCAAGGQCVPLGECPTNPGGFCWPAGSACAGGATCTARTVSYCAETYSCEETDYARPAVEIVPLTSGADALLSSMNAKIVSGRTPTAAALQGGVEHARAWAQAHPTHKVVTVIATDGLPTECSPRDAAGLAEIAAQGVRGSTSIPTFVIGVFASDDMSARTTMNAIAVGGGTDQATIVDARRNVAQDFLDALNAIRGKSLACEYAIPQPSGADMIDYNRLNVEHTPAGASAATTIYHVKDLANCDPMNGGWYYDVAPESGATPTKIIMCPTTCGDFRRGGEVELRVGCQTVIPPAR